MHRRTLLAAALALPSLPSLPALPGQHLTFAEGTPAALQIVAVPEANPAAPGTVVLSGVELQPIEITGRTLAQPNDATRSRRIVRHGSERVELPGGGRLFRYRRLGGQFWGYLHVNAGGAPLVALELPGTGSSGIEDPFADRIAVGADGQYALAVLRSGGLHVLRLDGGTFASTGRTDRFVATAPIEPQSPMVGDTHAFFQTMNARLFRLALADGGLPTDETPPPQTGAILKDQMALSGDGRMLVFLYGPRDQQRFYRLGTGGPATVLPPPPSKYEEPGYLPEGPGEPALLLNHDGSRLFYIDSIVRDELHLLDLHGVLPDLQITADPIFQPYIGVHILPSFAAGALTVAIGDQGRMDWFRAELTPLGGVVTNLTATGSAQQPFPAGQLDPVQAAPAGSALFVTERTQQALLLRRLDPASGAQAVLHQDLASPPEPGSSLRGTADLVARGAGGDRLYRGSTGTLLAATPPGLLLEPPSHAPGFAVTWLHLANQWGMVVFYLRDGTALAGPLEHGVTQLAATANDGVVVVGTPLRYLAPGVFVVLPRPSVAHRVCLSGAGG